jgi:hypothetical protein
VFNHRCSSRSLTIDTVGGNEQRRIDCVASIRFRGYYRE